GKDVTDLEAHLAGDAGRFCKRIGFNDALRVDVDADAARAETPGRFNHDSAVAAPEVVHHVGARDVGDLQHRGDDRIFAGEKDDVGRAHGRLREDDADEEEQG